MKKRRSKAVRRRKRKGISRKQAGIFLRKLKKDGPDGLSDHQLGQLLIRSPKDFRKKAREELNID